MLHGVLIALFLFVICVHACRLFLLQVVTEGHIIAAAMSVKGVLSVGAVSLDPGQTVNSLAKNLSEQFLEPIFFDNCVLPKDEVYTYACETMLMGLLWYGFKDAIREGDGPAVMSFWKVLTVIFKLTGHTK